ITCSSVNRLVFIFKDSFHLHEITKSSTFKWSPTLGSDHCLTAVCKLPAAPQGVAFLLGQQNRGDMPPMRQLITFALLSSLILYFPARSWAAEKQINVPGMTSVPIMLKQPVYGNSLQAGDRIPVAVGENIQIDGVQIFKKGDPGYLLVDRSTHTKAFGRGGALDIRSGMVRDVKGTEHPIQFTQHSKGANDGSAVVLPVISLFVLWPLALFAFRNGREASIPAGSVIPGVTTGSFTLAYDGDEKSPELESQVPTQTSGKNRARNSGQTHRP
ncbi:MAG: hypothetical protein VKJ04_01985, partial [Vampirovibrionales bacterium]|nr:hypothetical protein [Vampirovibrionales bacterium]